MNRLNVNLKGLRTFEAAARHESIKLAAAELGVSPSAVSHQIASLEDHLGVHLLTRNGRGVRLTEDGARLLPKLTAGFDLLAGAIADQRDAVSAGPLRISVLETFALYWLTPRLRSFPFGQDGLELEISTSQRRICFDTENFHAAIRLGHGDWTGVKSERLFPETMGLFRRGGSSGEEGRLFLSAQRSADWQAWCGTCGSADYAGVKQVQVGSTSLAIKAAMDGSGLAFAGVELCRSEVEMGRLESAVLHTAPSGLGGYWLVYPPGLGRDRRVRRLRKWLVEKAHAAAV